MGHDISLNNQHERYANFRRDKSSTASCLTRFVFYLADMKLVQSQPYVDGVFHNSTGILYFHDKPIDNYLHKYAADSQKITFSINPANSYKCLNSQILSLNDWQCTRLVVIGNLVNVTDSEELSSVRKAFKERHDVSLEADHVYTLLISELRLIQVLTGDSAVVDIGEYYRTRQVLKMEKSEVISLDDKDFVRKMKSVHSSRRKHLRGRATV